MKVLGWDYGVVDVGELTIGDVAVISISKVPRTEDLDTFVGAIKQWAAVPPPPLSVVEDE